MAIRPVTSDDAAAIASIYNYYVTDTVITFEEEVVTANEIARRIGDVRLRDLPWTVWEANEEILGFAYAGRFRERIGYRFTVESSVYLAPDKRGQGIGFTLYSNLIDRLRTRQLDPVHRVIGAIALPNDSSVKLHERLGFRQAGLFSEVGYKFGRWVDVGYWQLDLT